MIEEYLEHHFELKVADNFRTESDKQRAFDPYPDFRSETLTHLLHSSVVRPVNTESHGFSSGSMLIPKLQRKL